MRVLENFHGNINILSLATMEKYAASFNAIVLIIIRLQVAWNCPLNNTGYIGWHISFPTVCYASPDGCKAAYKNAHKWKKIFSRMEPSKLKN